MDGPGLDTLDAPGGDLLPKLQFTAFVPTADFFNTLRVNQASLDLPAAELPHPPTSPSRLTTSARELGGA